jgi:hypothetical protein
MGRRDQVAEQTNTVFFADDGSGGVEFNGNPVTFCPDSHARR